MQPIKNIAIMFGGNSPEHEVSVITGLQVLNNVDEKKYNPIPIYISKDGRWYTGQSLYSHETYKNLDTIKYKSFECFLLPYPNNKQLTIKTPSIFRKNKQFTLDAIFPCFHGGLGENGAFQGFFEMAEIPYVGSGILGSIAGMDKVITKQLLDAVGINQTPYIWFYKKTQNKEIIAESEKKFGYPVFVKPANSGSSIGVTKAKNKTQLNDAIEVAKLFDNKIIIERSIEKAKEINISVMGISYEEIKTSVCEEVFSNKDFLNYDEKYKKGGGRSKGMASTNRKIPAEINNKVRKDIEETAKKAFSALNCHGLARIDFLYQEKTNRIYLIEVNTIPGSMSFYLWKETKLDFKSMVDELIYLAIKRYEKNKSISKAFQSNILENIGNTLKTPKIKG